MIKRRLGADGPEITAVGYGSMSFGAAYGPTTRENSVAILDAMQDLGLDHFDTAYIYAGGEAETIFGDYCRQSPAARGRRGRGAGSTRGAAARGTPGSTGRSSSGCRR